jgi:hypothetical protein
MSGLLLNADVQHWSSQVTTGAESSYLTAAEPGNRIAPFDGDDLW